MGLKIPEIQALIVAPVHYRYYERSCPVFCIAFPVDRLAVSKLCFVSSSRKDAMWCMGSPVVIILLFYIFFCLSYLLSVCSKYVIVQFHASVEKDSVDGFIR